MVARFRPSAQVPAAPAFSVMADQVRGISAMTSLLNWRSLCGLLVAASLAYPSSGLAGPRSKNPTATNPPVKTIPTIKEWRRLGGAHGEITIIAFSPSSKILASVARDNLVRLWNPGTGKEVCRLEG